MGPFIYFAILSIIYTVIRYKVTDPQQGLIWGVVYICLLAIGMFFINLSVTKHMCGTTQPGTAIMVTAIPWTLIFGVTMLMLLAFPGWLAPFSNTFGYLVAKLAGLGVITDKIIAPKAVNKDTAAGVKAASEALEQIYSDKALLVNQITPSNFNAFWDRMSKAGLFNKGAGEFKEALYNLVRLKNNVAELVWGLLAGGLATSVSTSYIQNTACEQSAKEMIARHNQYEADAEKKSASPKKPRVYSMK